MDLTDIEAPAGHTPEGGVVVGSSGARRRMVVYEDPQCPFCRRFERHSGDMLRREVSAGAVAIEYRMRCFLGPESVRAANALALAGEEQRFDQLRMVLFELQPPEGTGGFTHDDLVDMGRSAGLSSPRYVEGVRAGRFEPWALLADGRFQLEAPDGVPTAFLDGSLVDREVLYEPEALGALIRG